MFGNTPAYNLRKPSGRTVPLQSAASAVFDTRKSASLALGPQRANQYWRIQRMVTTAGATGDSIRLVVYRNAALPSNIIDSTYQGASATSETDLTLLEGEFLVCNWDGGTAGTSATMIVTGEIIF